MMTQTHILIGLAAFGRQGDRLRNLAAIAGGIVPDAAIFALYGVEKARGTPEKTIWEDIYFNSPFWQDLVAWENSAPLWLGLLVVGFVLKKRTNLGRAADLIMVFAGSCLAHVACDFPLHVEDAHRHLFPFSDWRFHSPVSYWDPNHFGIQAATCEALLGIGLSIWMWLRFKTLTARSLIALLAIGYLAIPMWFAIQFMSSGAGN
jgi:membrane-bound metal-dependent hydrolase YbcI (DUF457 family)